MPHLPTFIEPLEPRQLLTVLTFDPDGADGAVLPQAYGDRAVGATGGPYQYGTAGGPTPNVRASYAPNPENVRQFRDGYGDLHNVIYADDAAGGITDIYLAADLNYEAVLASIQLAGKGADFTINSVAAFDGDSGLMTRLNNVKVEGDGSGAKHTTVDLSGVHSRIARIRIDASNLGANADKIGIDNIQFSQTQTTSEVGDGFADVVLSYHDSGAGGIAGPYGGNAENNGGAPVGLSTVIGDDASSPSYLSLPTDSYVVLGFVDETAINDSGDDLFVTEFVDTGEQAKVFGSSDGVNFTFFGTAKSGRTNKFDIGGAGFNGILRQVKIVGSDAGGGSPGFDLLNVQVSARAMRQADGESPTSFAGISPAGLLSVNGTEAGNNIALTPRGGSIDVARNGVTFAFDQSITAQIQVFAMGGNDIVSVNDDLIGAYVDGGAGNDLLRGGNRKDTLTGGAGKNTLFGNAGDDRLNGSGAPDLIAGGEGADRLYGNDGDDTLSGEAGVDRLFGGNGNDSLVGGSSNDKLYGEAGNDTLLGGNQNDSLEGGAGNDSLAGNTGIDTIFANSGKDSIDARDGLADSVDGGADSDQGLLDDIDQSANIETLLP